jgi:aspartyl-tRNA(Asn)/glutamyl-tRNA(Gln) amidotransferase subunit C
MSKVSTATVEHIARLARIGVHGDLLEQLAGQMETILTYVEQLNAVNTDGIEPTTHVLPLSNVLREDEAQPGLDARQVTDLAPAKHPPFVTVPKVIEG